MCLVLKDDAVTLVLGSLKGKAEGEAFHLSPCVPSGTQNPHQGLEKLMGPVHGEWRKTEDLGLEQSRDRIL